MHPPAAHGNSLPSYWQRVRAYAVPPSMIETATARRRAGDWAGACAAAHIDVDLRPRALARSHGRDLADRVRADLARLAPDLLRWHMPRTAPDGLLRPGLTVPLARYGPAAGDGTAPVYLVVRTPPARADGGQRFSLTLWDGERLRDGARRHPHPRPSRRFRLDLHRHLWDAGRSGELRTRAGSGRPPDGLAGSDLLPPGHGGALDRWADEARIVLRDAGRATGAVTVRPGGRRRLVLDVTEGTGARLTVADGRSTALPVLPDAATHVLPDLVLLRTGALQPGRLHPLVAAALAPDRAAEAPPRPPEPAGAPHRVDCRGAQHRIGLVDGVLTPLDHPPDEIRRETLLAELTGTPLPCLQAVDRAHRHPDCLTGVRERLDHGDLTGALDVVEGLLGPGARLRSGPLRDALEAAARRRVGYGLHRADMDDTAPGRSCPPPPRPAGHRSRPRLAIRD